MSSKQVLEIIDEFILNFDVTDPTSTTKLLFCSKKSPTELVKLIKAQKMKALRTHSSPSIIVFNADRLINAVQHSSS